MSNNSYGHEEGTGLSSTQSDVSQSELSHDVTPVTEPSMGDQQETPSPASAGDQQETPSDQQETPAPSDHPETPGPTPAPAPTPANQQETPASDVGDQQKVPAPGDPAPSDHPEPPAPAPAQGGQHQPAAAGFVDCPISGEAFHHLLNGLHPEVSLDIAARLGAFAMAYSAQLQQLSQLGTARCEPFIRDKTSGDYMYHAEVQRRKLYAVTDDMVQLLTCMAHGLFARSNLQGEITISQAIERYSSDYIPIIPTVMDTFLPKTSKADCDKDCCPIEPGLYSGWETWKTLIETLTFLPTSKYSPLGQWLLTFNPTSLTSLIADLQTLIEEHHIQEHLIVSFIPRITNFAHQHQKEVLTLKHYIAWYYSNFITLKQSMPTLGVYVETITNKTKVQEIGNISPENRYKNQFYDENADLLDYARTQYEAVKTHAKLAYDQFAGALQNPPYQLDEPTPPIRPKVHKSVLHHLQP